MAILEKIISKSDVLSAYPEMYPTAYDTDVLDGVEVGGEAVTVSSSSPTKDEKKLRKIFNEKGYSPQMIAGMLLIAEEMTKAIDPFKYKNYKEFALELEMRYNLIQTMEFVEKNKTIYENRGGPNMSSRNQGETFFHYGLVQHIDSKYWEPLDALQNNPDYNSLNQKWTPIQGPAKAQFRYIPSDTNTPSAAVDHIFHPTDNMDVVLDCNSMMVAIQYYAMLQTYGEKKFNKMFPNGKGLMIGPVRDANATYPDFTETPNATNKTGTNQHPFIDLSLYDEKDYQPLTFAYVSADKRPKEDVKKPPVLPGNLLGELVPGDWVYFKNHSEYADITSNAGAWSGEHAMYLGDGKFTGFGMGLGTQKEYPGRTYYEILEELQNAYLEAFDTYEKKNKTGNTPKTIDQIPGIVVRFRPKMTAISKLK